MIPSGWRLVPVNPQKRPLLAKWPEQASADPTVIARWRRRPRCRLAVMTGPESGVMALDVDTPDGHGVDGRAALRELARKAGPLPATVTAVTPSGGRHLFFVWPAGRHIRSRPLLPGLDVKGWRGLVTLPPAPGRHWLASPLDRPLAALPRPWLDLIDPVRPTVTIPVRAAGSSRFAAAALEREVAAVAGAGRGERNHALNRAAFALGSLVGAGALDAATVASALASAALAAGLDRHEIAATLESGLAAGMRQPRELRR
jgi:hypothetical protein